MTLILTHTAAVLLGLADDKIARAARANERPSNQVTCVGDDMATTHRICSIPDCNRSHHARGWCSKHWQRWQRLGSPLDAPTPSPEEFFWAHVNKRGPNDCWEWTHTRQPLGYGEFSNNGTHYRAHRFSLELATGVPLGSLYALHRCDNPPCVNPKHLYAGTPADNTADIKRRGEFRARKGEKHWNAKLTASQARLIREQYAKGGISQQGLAVQFGVSRRSIYDVIARKTWAHISP